MGGFCAPTAMTGWVRAQICGQARERLGRTVAGLESLGDGDVDDILLNLVKSRSTAHLPYTKIECVGMECTISNWMEVTEDVKGAKFH